MHAAHNPLPRRHGPVPGDLRNRHGLLHQFVLAGSSASEEEAREVRASIDQLDQLDDHCFGQLISQQVNFGVLEKQQLLETSSNLDRYKMLELLLRFQITLLDKTTPLAGSNLPQ